MADITTQATVMYEEGNCGKVALFSVKNANAADTIDVSSHFRVIKRAGLISETGATIGNVTNTGTTLTVPAGPASDGVWIFVVGVAV